MNENYDAHFKLDDFGLYQHAREFRKLMYNLIPQLPTHEKFCLAPQMRRAAISVSNNVAEGHGRWHFQENMQFCRISRGSVAELIDDLNICLDAQYMPVDEAIAAKQQAAQLIARLNSYIHHLRRKQGSNK